MIRIMILVLIMIMIIIMILIQLVNMVRILMMMMMIMNLIAPHIPPSHTRFDPCLNHGTSKLCGITALWL